MSGALRIGVTSYDTPGDREIVIRRLVDAPRTVVFDAWTNPEDVPKWLLGPEGWAMPVCEIDLRPGGAWRYVWRREDGTEMSMSGEVREVVPPQRLVTTERWGDDWPETLNTLVLSEQDGKTTITLTATYPAQEARDGALQTGMMDGVNASLDRLDRMLGTRV